MTEGQPTPTFETIKAEAGGFDPTQLSDLEWSPPSWEQYRRDAHKANVLDGIEAPVQEDLPWLQDIISGAEWRLNYVKQLVSALRATQSGPDTPGSADAPATGERRATTGDATGDDSAPDATVPISVDPDEVEATRGGPDWSFPVDDEEPVTEEVPEVPIFATQELKVPESDSDPYHMKYVLASANGGKLHFYAGHRMTLCDKEVNKEATDALHEGPIDSSDDKICKECKKRDAYVKHMQTGSDKE